MPRSGKKKPTLIDVAHDAGVSTATASLVVRHSPLVSDKTRSKVLQSIKRLGYVHDRIAASLRSRVSSTIGVIITDIANPFLAEVLVDLHQALSSRGYSVLLGTTFDSINKQSELIETMVGHKICGLVLFPVGPTTLSNLAVLESTGTPTVLFGRDLSPPDQNHYDSVIADTYVGAQLVVDHLVVNGHKRIAFLGGKDNISIYSVRFSGYRETLRAHGLEVDMSMVLQGPTTFDFGNSAIKKMLELPDPPTAAFCYNDVVAIGAIQGLQNKKLLAGRDIALVGFDDIKHATITNPALTTVSIDINRWGNIISRMLAKRILDRSAPSEKIIITPRLVVRDSSLYQNKR
jgi:LacI family transcriptional regulator